MGFVHFTECFSSTKEFWLNHKRIRRKLKEYSCKPETIDIIIENTCMHSHAIEVLILDRMKKE